MHGPTVGPSCPTVPPLRCNSAPIRWLFQVVSVGSHCPHFCSRSVVRGTWGMCSSRSSSGAGSGGSRDHCIDLHSSAFWSGRWDRTTSEVGITAKRCMQSRRRAKRNLDGCRIGRYYEPLLRITACRVKRSMQHFSSRLTHQSFSEVRISRALLN